MSDITINKNIHRGFKVLGKIPNLYTEFVHNDAYRSLLFGDMLKMQYSLVRNYLTKRYIDWLHVDSEFKGLPFLNHYYRNFYSTNFQALHDELYEVDNALSNQQYDKEKKYFLTIEEIVDVAHFIFQYIDYIEEQRCILSHEKRDMINNICLKNLIVNTPDIYNCVHETLERKSSHIIQEVHSLPVIEDNNWLCISEIWKTLQYMHLENRTFMRYINWKPWKNYPDDHYSIPILSGMEYSTRKLFEHLIRIFHIALRLIPEHYNQYVEWLYEEFPEFENLHVDKSKSEIELSITYSILYAAYMAKNLENQRRQIDDPRYKGVMVEYVNYCPFGLKNL